MTWRSSRALELLGIEAPLVLGPFGGMSSVALTAAVSNEGGLGSYGLYGYDGERIRTTTAELRAATPRPFALNIWLPFDGDHDVHPDAAAFARYLEPLLPYFAELAVAVPDRPERYLPSLDEQLAAVIDARPAVLSTVFGVPPPDVVERAHEAGIRVIGTATTVEEAVALEAGGVDAIVATGMEAGGHRVSFLRPAEESLVGTLALVPQVVDAVTVPVIAAGGIADGRGLAAVLALGADAAQIGTAFLATEQSAAPAGYRAALHGPDAANTALTRAMSGRLARGIPNRLVREIAQSAPFPVQNWITGRFRAVAGQRDLPELMSLWAGQGAPLSSETDAATLFRRMIIEALALR